MPTASPELRAEWHEEGDTGAIKFLEGQGHILLWDWRWLVNKQPNEKSRRAMAYLIDEWDFGGWLTVRDLYKEVNDGMLKVRAERDRYREALEAITGDLCFDPASDAQVVARQALKGEA